MMTQEEIVRLQCEAETEFKKYPGVIGVGYGFKIVEGQTTDILSFCIYVTEKKDRALLASSEIIPADFKGIPTDVMAVEEVSLVGCEDFAYHSPLVGGITISHQKLAPVGHPDAGKPYAGTLGFFATINGQPGPENVALVSNNHVLMKYGAQIGDVVYQPEFIDVGGQMALNAAHDKLHPIGKIYNAGFFGDHPFQYPGESSQQYGVDCTSAQLDISISSWCNTNCGIHFKNEIRNLNIGGNNAISNVGRVKQSDLQPGTPYVVYKVGCTTSRTEGKVIKVNHIVQAKFDKVSANSTIFHSVIQIESTANNCNGVLNFVEEGDSGSALINAQNEIIGLVFGSNNNIPQQAVACHIHPILDKLGVTPITTANPHTAADTFFDVPGVITEGGFNHTPLLREKFLRSERGREIFSVIKTHRMEVVDLVNHRRPVTVVWHRNNGPAFLSHLINNARDPEYIVPREVEGVDRGMLIQNMANILSKHGSAELRNALEQYGNEIFSRTDQLDNLHELVKQFDVDQPDVQRDAEKEPSTLDSGETV